MARGRGYVPLHTATLSALAIYVTHMLVAHIHSRASETKERQRERERGGDGEADQASAVTIKENKFFRERIRGESR